MASLGSPQWEAEEDLRKDSAELLLETYLAEYEVCRARCFEVIPFLSPFFLLVPVVYRQCIHSCQNVGTGSKERSTSLRW
jgi:hypothetical protein